MCFQYEDRVLRTVGYIKMKMKNLIKVIAAAVIAAGAAGCGPKQTEAVISTLPAEAEKKTPEPAEVNETAEGSDMIVGGWSVNQEETAIENYPEVLEALEKATEGLTGYTYEPYALLATQVVSGMNYCILCRGHAVVPEPSQEIMLLYLYKDLNGNAEIIGKKNIFRGQEMPGSIKGNTGSLSLDDNEEVKAAFDGALMNLTGASYEPVAYLGDQIVKGTNYVILCRIRAVAPDAVGKFAYVTVYQKVDEPAMFKDVTEIEYGVYDE